ncbi:MULTISPECIES: DeoR family transcriptional regulator [unclassified Micromonospora]|uniref:DeoR family transcriptional regulator n=1 Tax=unclassified Micromonospora TaxID=2617518 RepID=UPI0020B3B1E3|nr:MULTISPECIES: DeoR family transcriptional regulator [unclassified Micromonospora]MDM4778736.1 DeoR family transcriptional regulator [Micromonospora sp. b486]
MGDQGATRRLSPRRWRILSYLAQHGSATTLDVALVCRVARLTAHRDLVWLHEAGLVRRDRSAEDRTHTWWYEVTPEGTDVLRRALTASGLPVPLRLGQRPSGRADALLFLPLIEVSRRHPGRCELFQWLATMETSAWLRQHDLAQVRADGYGVWLQDGRCLRFLVHVDRGPSGGAVAEHERATSGLGGLLAGYRRADRLVPVGAVLLIAQDAEREERLRVDLLREPLQNAVATTTQQLLYRHWPDDQVWQVPGENGRRRLIEVGS